MTAIDRLRAYIEAEGWPDVPLDDDDALDALAAVDVLYQAAKEVWDATDHLTDPERVRTGEASEQEAGVRMTLAVQALAAAVRRVEGE